MSIDVRIVGWRAWYTEGRKFDSATTRWEDLPPEGALVFMLYQRTRGHRRIMACVSLYWKDGDIYACDNVADALIPQSLPEKFIKRGRWTTDQEYLDAYQAAWAHEDAPDESLRTDGD
jgi:hypothetical protein